ncbi:MAG: hypothetical protein HRT74_07670 [Flavobacteriales bacterium]|nr:hypothetical protein [Flavobacteriales bacterium]
MIGSYGWLIGGMMLGFPVLILIMIGLKFLFKGRKFIDLAMCTITGLFIVHAFTAGHAINSPTVSTAIVVAYFYGVGYEKIYHDQKILQKIEMAEAV